MLYYRTGDTRPVFVGRGEGVLEAGALSVPAGSAAGSCRSHGPAAQENVVERRCCVLRVQRGFVVPGPSTGRRQ